jgi:hypothetical protein
MNALQNHSEADFSEVAPLLDEALNELWGNRIARRSCSAFLSSRIFARSGCAFAKRAAYDQPHLGHFVSWGGIIAWQDGQSRKSLRSESSCFGRMRLHRGHSFRFASSGEMGR